MRHLLKTAKYLQEFQLNDGKQLDLKRGEVTDELSILTSNINVLKRESTTGSI